MRKIVLAAAIATSALGLAACGETANEASDMADAMAADAESISDEATAMTEEGAEAAAAEGAAASDAAGAVADAAEAAAAEAEKAMASE
jgi:hypothetical protein